MPIQFGAEMLEVGFVTARMPEMLHFYREILGLPYESHLEYPGGMQHRFSLGGSILKLASFDAAPAQPGVGGGPFAGVSGIRYVSFNVANIHELVAAVRDAGHPIPREVTAMGPAEFAFVEDPDGNWIELYQTAAPSS